MPLPRMMRAGDSSGQAMVEAAVALMFMVVLFAVVVTAGQFVGYTIGLTNAASSAASAAARAPATPSAAAVTAVNQEQGTANWSACGGGAPVPPCVSVSSVTTSTAASATVGIEVVTLHANFSPVFNLLGVSFPVTATAGASN